MLPIIVSFSGGRTSAYMLRLLLDNCAGHPIHVVFANTGRERPETLDFVQECAVRWNVPITWLEAVVHPEKGKATTHRIVDYLSVWRRNDDACRLPQHVASEPHPFEAVIAKYGIPNLAFPHCSRELKQQPIASWLRETLAGQPFQMALGIRADEQEREGKWWYPLIEWGVTKQRVREFWRDQPFDLGLKDYEGNCDLCFKKRLDKNLTLLEENPGIGDWWHEMERDYGQIAPSEADRRRTAAHRPLPLLDTLSADTLPAKKAGPYHFNEGGVSIAAMKEMMRRGRFRRAVDGEEMRACACGVEFENLLL